MISQQDPDWSNVTPSPSRTLFRPLVFGEVLFDHFPDGGRSVREGHQDRAVAMVQGKGVPRPEAIQRCRISFSYIDSPSINRGIWSCQ